MSEDEYSMRRHDNAIYRRQSPSPSTGSFPSSTLSSNLTASSTIAFPTPSTTPTATSVTVGLSHQLLNTSVNLDFTGNAAQGVSSDLDVKMSCKNCTTSGSIELSHGSFTVNGTNSTSNDTFLDQFLDYGFVAFGYSEFLIHNFTAHVELETSFSLSGTTSFTAPLGSFPLTPFTVSLRQTLNLHLLK